MKEILKRNYQYIVKNTFMVLTRSQTRSRGVKIPAMCREQQHLPIKEGRK